MRHMLLAAISAYLVGACGLPKGMRYPTEEEMAILEMLRDRGVTQGPIVEDLFGMTDPIVGYEGFNDPSDIWVFADMIDAHFKNGTVLVYDPDIREKVGDAEMLTHGKYLAVNIEEFYRRADPAGLNHEVGHEFVEDHSDAVNEYLDWNDPYPGDARFVELVIEHRDTPYLVSSMWGAPEDIFQDIEYDIESRLKFASGEMDGVPPMSEEDALQDVRADRDVPTHDGWIDRWIGDQVGNLWSYYSPFYEAVGITEADLAAAIGNGTAIDYRYHLYDIALDCVESVGIEQALACTEEEINDDLTPF